MILSSKLLNRHRDGEISRSFHVRPSVLDGAGVTAGPDHMSDYFTKVILWVWLNSPAWIR
jgi:hypothetical protein